MNESVLSFKDKYFGDIIVLVIVGFPFSADW